MSISIILPQGSVLGPPFLFLVCIDHHPNSCNSQMIFYAVDSAIICSKINIQNLKRKSKNELCKIENWIKLNRLTFNNKKKNNCMLFDGRSNKTDKLSLTANNGLFKGKNAIKY